MKSATGYTSHFYANQAVSSKISARHVLNAFFQNRDLPRTAIDVGCGVGTWASTLSELGVATVCGADGDHVPRCQLLFDEAHFYPIDLEHENLTVRISEKFDFLCCLEVAEHLSAARAASFIEELTLLSGDILFSAAIPQQGGTLHINEQWQSYWVALFRGFGFHPDFSLRLALWDNTAISPWYRQNIIHFSNRNEHECHMTVDVVHPDMWMMRLNSVKDRYENDISYKAVASLRQRGVLHTSRKAAAYLFRKAFYE